MEKEQESLQSERQGVSVSYHAVGDPSAPPPAYAVAAQQAPVDPHAVVIQTQQADPVAQCKLSREPVAIQCPHCHQAVTTTTNTKLGLVNYIASGFICFVGCWLGCCLIPLCIDSIKDVVHTCPSCHQGIGVSSIIS